MNLRPYQSRAVDEVLANLNERPCLVAPTGSGKTFMATEIVRRLSIRALWVAHRRELIQQAALSLAKTGTRVGILMGSEPSDTTAPIQVASIQTLARRTPPRAGLLVIDEAHHARADCYAAVFDAYPNTPRIGLTATPFRLDGRGLGDCFGHLVVAARVKELVDDRTLIEPVVFAPGRPDLSGVRVTAGDYNLGELGTAMSKAKLVGDAVETWLKRGSWKRTVAFTVNVAHSRALTSAFCAAGVKAEHLDASTPKTERDAILARLRHGQTTLVSNCQVLTEGWDLPDLEVAIVARPTKSLCLHLQMIGRIMRAAPDKTGAIVLDHAGNHEEHGFVTQHIDYTLDDTKVKGETTCKRCPQCYLMVDKSESVCPECGYDFSAQAPGERAAIPQSRPGELVQITFRPRAAVPLDEQQSVWDDLEYRRRHFSFKPGWSYYKFRDRFGFDPMIHDGRIVTPDQAPLKLLEAEYQRLEERRAEKGYKRGWVGHQLAAKFGPRAWGFLRKKAG